MIRIRSAQKLPSEEPDLAAKPRMTANAAISYQLIRAHSRIASVVWVPPAATTSLWSAPAPRRGSVSSQIVFGFIDARAKVPGGKCDITHEA